MSRQDLVSIGIHEFNLGLTMESGQLFHWSKVENGYVGLIGTTPIYIEQQGSALLIPKGTEALVRHYFSLDHDLPKIYATFPKDPAMEAALGFCRGMRLVRQPSWECLATFITSSMKQVKHIEQMSAAIRSRYGKPVHFGDQILFSYPEPARLARLEERDLRDCGLGYRAKNLLLTSQMVAAGEVDLRTVAALPDEMALKELCRLAGVGEKVANCVLLFAYERMQAFPIDVWIERVLRGIYFKGKRKVTHGRMKQFSHEYFGPYGGYAQQYLFHHARRRSKP